MKKSLQFLNLEKALILVACLAISSHSGSLFAQQTYSFTTCGATGQAGPNQTNINSTYFSTNLAGAVTNPTAGIQSWTVPANASSVRIEAWGAQGGTSGSTTGGLGAYMRGDFTLTPGSVIKILVGQQGVTGTNQGGGGGGSFVTLLNNTPLLIAGGGGGSYYTTNSVLAANRNGTTSMGAQAGVNANGSTTSGAGGTGGNGGAIGTLYVGAQGAGGGGLLSNGANGSTSGAYGGTSFVTGGNGGAGTASPSGGAGGFGGGGGGDWSNWTGGGGGGGYSGGGGGVYYGGGGGGGSFNGGTNQTNTSGTNTGNGRVVITELCNISIASSITNTDNAICSGGSVTLTTNAISNYTWSNGATTTAIVVSPTATTMYSVVGTSSLLCTASSAYTVVVHGGIPALSIANTASATAGAICPNSSVALTGTSSTSGPVTLVWSNSVSNGIAFNPTVANVYTLTGSNLCGSSTATTSVNMSPSPTITAVASTASLCSGNSATLTGGTTGTVTVSSYTWSGGPVPVTNGAAFFPPSTSNYTVVGASANGCTAQAVANILVVLTPSATPIASPAAICIGACSSLSGSGATTYTWLPGNLNSSGVAMCPTVSTTYTLIKANGNCVDTKLLSVTVNTLPSVFAVANPTSVCASKPGVISGGGANTFTWQPGTLIGANPTVTPASTTNYTVTGTNTITGCTNTAAISMVTRPNPTISSVPSSTAICVGQTATITLSGGLTYTWTPSTLTGTQVMVSPPTSTVYTIVGENSVSCTHTISQVLVVNPNPTVIAIANPTLVCVSKSSTLTASGGNTYLWNTGSTTATNVASPLVTTIYTVTGTYTATGCNNTKTVSLSVYGPTVTVTGSFSSCVGGTVTITASVLSPSGYTWNPGTANPYYFPTIAVSPSVPTVYVVTALSTSNAVTCPATQTVGVAIYDNPTVTAVTDKTIICRYEVANISGQGASTYTWNTNQVGSPVPVSPLNQTNYTVTGTDANGCVGTATIQIKVAPCTGINEQSAELTALMVYPNPNNGEFVIEAEQSMDLTILNELGQLVRTVKLNSTTLKANVKDLAPGIYFIVGQNGKDKINQKIIVN